MGGCYPTQDMQARRTGMPASDRPVEVKSWATRAIHMMSAVDEHGMPAKIRTAALRADTSYAEPLLPRLMRAMHGAHVG